MEFGVSTIGSLPQVPCSLFCKRTFLPGANLFWYLLK